MGVHDFLSLVETFPMLGWLIECSDLYSLEYRDCEFVCLSNRWAWSNPGEQADEQGGVIQRRTEKGRRSVVDKRVSEADSPVFYSQEIQKALEDRRRTYRREYLDTFSINQLGFTRPLPPPSSSPSVDPWTQHRYPSFIQKRKLTRRCGGSGSVSRVRCCGVRQLEVLARRV